jgi:outer membrane protein TolC
MIDSTRANRSWELRRWARYARTAFACLFCVIGISGRCTAQMLPLLMPEEQCIPGRRPEQLPQVPVPDLPPPRTVDDPGEEIPPLYLSLDEAIRIALENAEVIRVLTGVGAANSGQTIYDPAIATPAIDEARSIFDPVVTLNNTWTRVEPPLAIFNPAVPGGVAITGVQTNRYDLSLDVTQQNLTGGTAGLRVLADRSRFQPGIFPLNPEGTSAVELSYVQPLLAGRGVDVNRVPIVLARIDAERSYFQLKDSVQELVRGVVDAYWGLVFARTDVWARRQQVEQGQFAFEQTQAAMDIGRVDIADLAQTRLAFAGFRANLVTAEANLIQQEAALRNHLGLPPTDARRLVPSTPPASERIEFLWQSLLQLAQQERPDIIELKLILEADQQQLLLARNRAQPQVDAVALYRWNGLEGEIPSGPLISAPDGTATDWTLGINFSVPIGLRDARAELRRQDLLIARDTANLNQQLHAMAHELATSLRNLAQFYAQYQAFRITREAARDNLEAQIGEYVAARTNFLNVLQAITDWGNAVSNEALALTQYNTGLASLERQTGTIIDTHGVRFFEERFWSIGPLGRLGRERAYPQALPPTANVPRYPAGEQPAEQYFRLDDPLEGVIRSRREPDAELLPPR